MTAPPHQRLGSCSASTGAGPDPAPEPVWPVFALGAFSAAPEAFVVLDASLDPAPDPDFSPEESDAGFPPLAPDEETFDLPVPEAVFSVPEPDEETFDLPVLRPVVSPLDAGVETFDLDAPDAAFSLPLAPVADPPPVVFAGADPAPLGTG